MTCKAADLQKSYKFALSGSSFPMAAGEVSSTVALKGVMAADVNGNFKLTLQGDAPLTADVTINVESDCTLALEFAVPVEKGGTGTSTKLRGILVNSGNEILAIQTDPGWMVSGKIYRRINSAPERFEPAVTQRRVLRSAEPALPAPRFRLADAQLLRIQLTFGGI